MSEIRLWFLGKTFALEYQPMAIVNFNTNGFFFRQVSADVRHVVVMSNKNRLHEFNAPIEKTTLSWTLKTI
jgi:hypothetical protein